MAVGFLEKEMSHLERARGSFEEGRRLIWKVIASSEIQDRYTKFSVVLIKQ